MARNQSIGFSTLLMRDKGTDVLSYCNGSEKASMVKEVIYSFHFDIDRWRAVTRAYPDVEALAFAASCPVAVDLSSILKDAAFGGTLPSPPRARCLERSNDERQVSRCADLVVGILP